MELIKKGLLLVTLISIMGTIKTEIKETSSMDAYYKEKMKDKKLRKKQDKKDAIRSKAERKLLKNLARKEQANQQWHRIVVMQNELTQAVQRVNKQDQYIQGSYEKINELRKVLLPLSAISLVALAGLLAHTNFNIKFASHS